MRVKGLISSEGDFKRSTGSFRNGYRSNKEQNSEIVNFFSFLGLQSLSTIGILCLSIDIKILPYPDC